MEESKKTNSLPLNLVRIVEIIKNFQTNYSKNSVKDNAVFQQIAKAIRLLDGINSDKNDEADTIKLAKALVILKLLIRNLNASNQAKSNKPKTSNLASPTRSLINELTDHLKNQYIFELESSEIDYLINKWIVFFYKNHPGNKENYYHLIYEYQATMANESFTVSPNPSNSQKITYDDFFNANRNGSKTRETQTADTSAEKITNLLREKLVAGKAYFHLFRLQYLLFLEKEKDLGKDNNFSNFFKRDEQAGGSPQQGSYLEKMLQTSNAKNSQDWLRKKIIRELKKLSEFDKSVATPDENASLETLIQQAKQCTKNFDLPKSFSSYKNTDFVVEGFDGPHRYPMTNGNEIEKHQINANYDSEQGLIYSAAPWLSDVNFRNYAEARNIGLVISIHANETDYSDKREAFYDTCQQSKLSTTQLIWPDNSALSLKLQNAYKFYRIYQAYLSAKEQGKTTYIHCTSGVGRTGELAWMFRCLNALKTNQKFNEALTELVLNRDKKDENINLVADIIITELTKQRLIRYSVHSEEQRDEFFPNFMLLSAIYILLNNHASLTADDLTALDKLQAKFNSTFSPLEVILPGENIKEEENTSTLVF